MLGEYLVCERGLADRSVRRYLPAARVFLATVPPSLGAGLAELSAGQVTGFVLGEATPRGTADAKSMVTALRSLLRSLFVAGRIPHPLAAAVPTVANRRLGGLPRRLDAGQADALLDSCDRGTPGGIKMAILSVCLSAAPHPAVESDDESGSPNSVLAVEVAQRLACATLAHALSRRTRNCYTADTRCLHRCSHGGRDTCDRRG